MRIDKTANKKTKERGSALMEMTVIIPLCGIILSGILTFGAFIHISFATRQSAFDCAMMAAQSKDRFRGWNQEKWPSAHLEWVQAVRMWP